MIHCHARDPITAATGRDVELNLEGERLVSLAAHFGCEPANPDEARKIKGMKSAGLALSSAERYADGARSLSLSTSWQPYA